MGENSPLPRLIRIGQYELDTRTGELRKGNARLQLHKQPLQILLLLLEHPGELVSREELRTALWPNHTFVDFDGSLNHAVQRLRAALDDTAEKPHFIETLARRGYRFIAPVNGATQTSSSALGAKAPTAGRRRVIVLAAPAAVAIVLGFASWLLLHRAGPAAPQAGLKVVPLTTYLGSELYPTFSPDGSQVAFAWKGEREENSHIYVKFIGSEPPLRLTTNPANEYSPAWSPDGRWVAFCRDLPGGKYAVMLTSPIPGSERLLTDSYRDKARVEGPFLAWSPDSRWLAMAGREESEESLTLFLFSLQSGEKRKLTSPHNGEFRGDSCPAFSRNGRRLAFFRWTAWGNSDLYLLDLSPDLRPSAAPKRLTFGNWRAASPAWSQDGKSLVFSALAGLDSGLWRVDISGPREPRRLVELGSNSACPAISLRGNRLVYAQVTTDTDIWRVEVPTSGKKTKPPERLISSTRNEDSPQFSPDGTRIAFVSDRSGSQQVWVCNADGSNAVRLTNISGGITPPYWSPDSRRLTFSANIEGHSDVYVIGASGGNPRRLTSGPIGSANPNWSREGRWILFDTVDSGIFKVPTEAGRAVRVSPAEGWAPLESPDGKFLYGIGNGPDGYSLWRVASGGGKAQLVLNSLDHYIDYALVQGGIYFIPKRDPQSVSSIQYLNTDTGSVQRIFSVENPAPGLTISPDRRWILYSRVERANSNLMLVENFR